MYFQFSAPELFLLLLILIFVIAVLSDRLHFSTPIALVLSGMGIAFIPSLPAVPLDPQLVFLIFLPPLLMEAAYFTSLRDFWDNIRPISLLAIGLVAVTTFAVGWVMIMLVPGIPAAAAFTLGAIISSPDAIAARSIAKRLKVPRRVLTILEGESLINDASGLIMYKFTVAAVMTGMFSWTMVVPQFLWAVIGGCAIGFVIAWFCVKLFEYIEDHTSDILLTFIVPYASYILAELAHSSGVLAVVVTGFVISYYSTHIFSPEFRLRAIAVWQTIVFVLNSFVFILIGWQFPSLLNRLNTNDGLNLPLIAFSVAITTILVRLVWVYFTSYGPRFIHNRGENDPTPRWQNVFVVGWTGMRGVVSLAAALALPYELDDHMPFPHRDLLIFLTFTVILSTLVLQGLSLPLIIRKLRLYRFIGSAHLLEAWKARKSATEAALAQIQEFCMDESLPPRVIRRINDHYRDRLHELGDGPSSPVFFDTVDNTEQESMISAERRLWDELITIERKTLIQLRHSREIGDMVMRELEQELDLMQAQYTRRHVV